MNLNETHSEHVDPGDPQGGFEVPEGYFEQLQSDLLRKTAGNGFTVPEGYFGSLESRIRQRIAEHRPVSVKIHYLRKSVIGIAATLLLAGAFFFLTFRDERPANHFAQTRMDELSDEEIIDYVEVADLNDAHINGMAVNIEDQAQKQVEDYLINQADEQLIMDEL